MADEDKNNTRVTNAVIAYKLDTLIDKVDKLESNMQKGLVAQEQTWRREMAGCQERKRQKLDDHEDRIRGVETTSTQLETKVENGFKAIQRDQTIISAIFSTVGGAIATGLAYLKGG